MAEEYFIPARTEIGHLYLKAADIQRLLAFYCDLMGFELTPLCGIITTLGQ